MSDVRIVSQTPCECCGGIGPTDCIDMQAKGGTACLCGYPNWVDTSPPSMYKTLTWGGGGSGCLYSVGGDDCPPDKLINNLSFSAHFDWQGQVHTDANCESSEVTPTGVARYYVNDDCSKGAFDQLFLNILAKPAGNWDRVDTPTVRADNGTGCNGTGANTIGSFTVTLSDEATEGEAIARVMAGADWYSDYGSIWGQRDPDPFSGTCFPYREGRYYVYKSGLLPNTAYRVTVKVRNRPANQTGGYGDFSDYSTNVVEATTDGSGFFLDGPHDLPLVQGYQFIAASDCHFTKVT